MNYTFHRKILRKILKTGLQSASMVGLGLGAIALAPLTTIATNTPAIDGETQQAMVDAIHDEYRARAFYTAVLDRFGEVRPFSAIVQAENRHVQLWAFLFTRYGLPIPADPFAGQLSAPDTLQAACQMGVEAEIANVQLYDSFLQFVQPPDLRAALTQLRLVSHDHHQPAFERCLTSGSGGGRRRGAQAPHGRWQR